MSLSQIESVLLRQDKKMSPKGADANQSLWMLQMRHYGDGGFRPTQTDYDGKKWRQATWAQDVRAIQPGHDGPQPDKSG